MNVAKQVAVWQRAESQKDNDELLGKLSAAGMQVNPVPEAHAGRAAQGRAEDLRRGRSPTSGPRASSSSSSASALNK